MSHQLCRSGVKCSRSHFHTGTTLQPWVGTRGRSPCLERAPGPCPSTSTLSLRRFLPPPSYPSPTEPRPVPPGHPAVGHSHLPLHCSQEIAWRIRRVSHHPALASRELAAAAGCGDKDTLSCLQALPARKLYLHLSLFQSCSVRQDLGIIYPAPWVPWVDATLKEPFLPK